MQSAINIEQFQDDIHYWFSHMTEMLTVWRDQLKTDRPIPILPYASLHIISGPTALAPQWEERRVTDLSRSAGKEIEVTYCVLCRCVVSCQIYGEPGFNSSGLLAQAVGGLFLEEIRTRFRRGNIAVERYSDIRDISGVISGENQSRANIDITFSTVMSIVAYEGYISTVSFAVDGGN